jgi:hypothetical protein
MPYSGNISGPNAEENLHRLWHLRHKNLISCRHECQISFRRHIIYGIPIYTSDSHKAAIPYYYSDSSKSERIRSTADLIIINN